MENNSFWKNKKVLITGGTSGLGKALSELLIEQGAKIAVVARRTPQKLTNNIHFIAGDVSDQKQIHRIHAEALSALGHIDVLINNASTLGPTPLRLLMDTECEDLRQVLETNLVGPFRLIKLVAPQMILNQRGVVVNISSDAAVNAYPHWGSYSVSKSALAHLSRIFQAELDGSGIQFLAVDPGDMDTPMHWAAIPNADRTKLRSPTVSAQMIIKMIHERSAV